MNHQVQCPICYGFTQIAQDRPFRCAHCAPLPKIIQWPCPDINPEADRLVQKLVAMNQSTRPGRPITRKVSQ